MRLARLAHRMALLELHAGNWQAADGYLRECDSLVVRTGQELLRQRSTLVQARLHALRGRLDAARAAAEEGLALAAALGARLDAGLAHATLGFVELSAGELSAAVAHLELADETYRSAGLGEPRLFRHQPDHVEVLAGLGELAAAEQALARFELQGRNPAKSWVIATAARCQGLLRAAQGDLEGAVERLGFSLAQEISEPFEHARSQLALGRIQRRRKQRKVARAALEAARTTFEALGAPLWETQAQAELDRTHVREAPRELTPTEEQVARFAAEGLKNREIAARLFVSPKTVETNLARAYRKLGVASRAELGAVMGNGPKARS